MKRFKLYTGKNTSRGSILPLAAGMVGVIILLTALVIYIMFSGTVKERIRSVVKLMALGAVESYFSFDCLSTDTVDVCHQKKMQTALSKAQEIMTANGEALADLQLLLDKQGELSLNEALLVPGRYFFIQPNDATDPCSGNYPCFVERQSGEYANAMQIKGSLKNAYVSRLLSFLGSYAPVYPVSFEETSAAVPLQIALLLDASESMARGTHLPSPSGAGDFEEDITVTLIDNGVQASQGGTYQSGGPGVPGVSGGGGGGGGSTAWRIFPQLVPPGSSPLPTPAPSFFAFMVDDPSNPTVIPTPVKEVWDGMPDNRPPLDTTHENVLVHYKDDYTIVERIPIGHNSWADSSYSSLHPDPSTDPNIYDPAIDHPDYADNAFYYWLDVSRGDNYMGPEPFLSALKGVREVVQYLKDRNVAGDLATLIVFDGILTWPRVIKLTNDFDYILSVADVPGIENPPQTFNGIYADEPLWIKYLIAPTPQTHTNIYLALTEAINQFSNSPFTIPAAQAIYLFSDGVATCSSQIGDTGVGVCSANYVTYKNAMTAITSFAYDSLYKSGIPLNVFLVGKHVG
ncbi:MAG: VWA domain-containing protein, partial [Candidatus Dadabacteria bacterium]